MKQLFFWFSYYIFWRSYTKNLSLFDVLKRTSEALTSSERDWSKVHTRVLHLHHFGPCYICTILVLVPNTMGCVLPRWSDNLLSINQSFTDFSSELKVAWISTISFPEASKTESSAYNNSLHLTAANMSVMYKRNNRGPSIEPCGMPQVISLATDIVPSTSVTCTLPVNYDQNQHIESSSTPTPLSFFKRMVWSTASKTFCKSNNTIPVNLYLPNKFCN